MNDAALTMATFAREMETQLGFMIFSEWYALF